VIRLALAGEDFYHLDTCFCPLDEKTALVYPPALAPAGLALVEALFERVIEVGEADARERFACNATACLGRTVVVQRGCATLRERLAGLYYDVVEVETGEFLKSGGSVYCMKQWLL
jgi:N-dimethylarginine dimethylaminohydrolase